MQQLESQTITVPESHAGRRLDKFLRSQLKGVPATILFRLMRKGAIRVNGRKCKQDDRISSGDEISLPALEIPDRGQRGPARGSRPGPRSSRRDPAVERLSQCLSRRIIFEDANLLILNKPGGRCRSCGQWCEGGCDRSAADAPPRHPGFGVSAPARSGDLRAADGGENEQDAAIFAGNAT